MKKDKTAEDVFMEEIFRAMALYQARKRSEVSRIYAKRVWAERKLKVAKRSNKVK